MNCADAAFRPSWVYRIVHSDIPYYNLWYVCIRLVILKGNKFLLQVFDWVSLQRDMSVTCTSQTDSLYITFTVLADPMEQHAVQKKYKGIVWI